MNFSKSLRVSLFLILFFVIFAGKSFSQERTRVVQNGQIESSTTNLSQRPPNEISQRRILPLTDQIVVQTSPPLIKRTGSSQPTNAVPTNYVSKSPYSQVFNQRLLFAIQTRYGIPYHYGSTGPNTYDCSGLVWSVFQDAGFYFERSSARTLWQESERVEGDDRYKFGTLVFFNGLGHIGIVADENGFYHASSSQGVTYSKFEGYWAKRIVGYRRLSIAR
ncbi:MAG: C40 family peptidase [Pyrinomonadaceae bacterium]